MKQKTRKRWSKIISLALAAAFLLCLPCPQVYAASDGVHGEDDGDAEHLESTVYVLPEEELADLPSPCTMLVNCSIVIGCRDDGLVVDITTMSTEKAEYLGIKDIQVQQKVWYGWKKVAYADDAEVSNCKSMGVSLVYAGAEVGETYRVHCVHYGKVDSYTEESHDSESVIFKH